MIEILQQYWQAYLWTDGLQMTGVAMTAWLLVLSIGIGFVLAVPLSLARVSENLWLRSPVWLFTYVFRGTPLYIQLLIIYSGIYSFDYVHEHQTLDAFFREGINCTILAFALNTGAYTTEIFAGAIRSIPHGEIEAAQAFGMSKWKRYTRIIIPSMLRRALPFYGNEVILMLHATTIAFTATVPDILKIARDVNAATYDTFNAFGIAAVLYAVLAFILIGLFRKLEKRWLAFLKPSNH
ncbi:ABC transporter permease [Acinetobacter pittii]|uniref:ABC transporter permease n=1 Tax=Acinetobacter pittii TaxID=48296 RepID=UPI001901AF3C|nr:ABC transporter permease [Acinetobacter pittii]MBJ8478077.1 ABC transporter permease [Acinetobacter pittii]MCU4340347.1 ABC transporter permease [Acinetobacter pittii]MCU4559690.1 ABC transporter permease [Acinetobacter pittii]